MDTKKLLLEFSAKHGVSGFETEAAQYAETLLAPFGTTKTSPLGSVICEISKPKGNGVHIMLDAHIDEIGLIVSYIEDKGFLRVHPCGGIDRRLLLASRVTVHAGDGGVAGVICSIPPHLNKDKDDSKNKKTDEIYIDIGVCDKTEAEKLVRPGDRVTINSDPQELLNGLVSGKAIDDRAGCVSLLKALEYLKLAEKPLDCGLTVVFSSMEEVGHQGAQTAAYSVNPSHAVVVDVSFAHTPDAVREKCGDLKKGPMIGIAPILDSGMSKRLEELALNAKIPFQLEVMGGRTGTNADSVAIARGGVRTSLISIPQKYMHTPIETVAVIDVENTGRLIAELIRDIDSKAGAQL